MISLVIGEFSIVVYHTLLVGADSCAHLNVSKTDMEIKKKPTRKFLMLI